MSEPSLTSLPVAVQVNKSETVTLLFGLMDTVLMVGSVFCMVAVAVVESIPPYPSATVAVQVMVSPTAAVDGLRVKVAELPNVVVPLVHA